MSMYPSSAVERAMTRQEIILRAMSGELTWIKAAEILDMHPRTLRRWRARWQRDGYDGLLDRRTQRPSPKRAPVEEVERVVRLYREQFRGFNVRHFHELAVADHQVTLSYSYVKCALQKAGLVPKAKGRGRHRRRRPRRERFGEMLHIDGSFHPWLVLAEQPPCCLLVVLDDATSEIVHARFWPHETTEAVLTALYAVVSQWGIPQSLYSDRASWAFLTPKAGGPVATETLTTVGEVLDRLGVEHIPSYCPQGRGRSERMNATLQGRLVNELHAAGISTLEAANRYLEQHYLPRHNQRFSQPAADADSAFVAIDPIDVEMAFASVHTRTVARDNTVQIHTKLLQIDPQRGRASCAGLKVTVRCHRTGHYTIWKDWRLLGCYEPGGHPTQVEAALGGALAAGYALRSRTAA